MVYYLDSSHRHLLIERIQRDKNYALKFATYRNTSFEGVSGESPVSNNCYLVWKYCVKSPIAQSQYN